MIKKFRTYADIASVLIGNDDYRIALPIYGGDGAINVSIFDSNQEFEDYFGDNAPDFLTTVEGKFNVYEEDCSKLGEQDIKETLNGRYGIYHGHYCLCFVCWEQY